MTIFEKDIKVEKPTEKLNTLIIELQSERYKERHVTVYTLWVHPIHRETKDGLISYIVDTGCPVESYKIRVLFASRASKKNERTAMIKSIDCLKDMRDTQRLLHLISQDEFDKLVQDFWEKILEKGGNK